MKAIRIIMINSWFVLIVFAFAIFYVYFNNLVAVFDDVNFGFTLEDESFEFVDQTSPPPGVVLIPSGVPANDGEVTQVDLTFTVQWTPTNPNLYPDGKGEITPVVTKALNISGDEPDDSESDMILAVVMIAFSQTSYVVPIGGTASIDVTITLKDDISSDEFELIRGQRFAFILGFTVNHVPSRVT